MLIKYKKCTKYVQFSRLSPLIGVLLMQLNYTFSPLLHISHQCNQFICIYLDMSTLASFVFTLVSSFVNVSKCFNVCFCKRLLELIIYCIVSLYIQWNWEQVFVQCKGIVKTWFIVKQFNILVLFSLFTHWLMGFTLSYYH